MRASSLVAICALMTTMAIHSANPDKPAEQPAKTLWELKRSALFPALRKFVESPGTKPDQQFVSVLQGKEGELLFKRVPEGWSTFKEAKYEGRLVLMDEDGFRILIELKQVADVQAELTNHIKYGQGYSSIILIDQLFEPNDSQVPRVVKCEKLKGDTDLTEYRYYKTKKGAVCVELTVFDLPDKKRTLDHLLSHLRSHYGKYEGICQQVADLVVEKP
jgi:hypothetical protein